jgi:protein-disulfide isomerase
MKNIPLLVGTLLGTLALIIGLSFMFSKSSEPIVADNSVLLKDFSHTKGPKEAKVMVVEFSDLQCPACRAAQPVVDDLLSRYGDRVFFVYRQYPLVEVHKNAMRAAQAAEAASYQNKFWELHDLFFETQDDWAELSSEDFDKKILEYTEKLQIDKTQFMQKIDSQEVRDRISADMADGNKVHIRGTPTFFVNGKETAAPQLLSTVESLLK